jgi:hypothetical protein
MAEFSFEGLLGGINNAFSGGSSNYLDEYLTPEQRRMIQRNAMLSASAALLKAGGQSTRRIGIGEALGEALQAGQAGYEKAQTGALTQMSLKQKMEEAKRAAELRKRIAGVFTPQTAMPGAAPVDAMLQPAAPTPMPKIGNTYPYTYMSGPKEGTSEQRIVTQADLDAARDYKGPTVQLPPDLTAPVNRPPTAPGMAMPMNQNVAKANQYRQVAKMLEDDGQLEKAMQYQKFALELDPPTTATGTALSKLIAERAMLPVGSPLFKAYDAAIEKESQFAPTAPRAGTLLSQLQADLAAATDPEIRSQIKARIQKEINNAPPPQNIVNVGGQILEKAEQKGMGEFLIKNFGEVSTAAGLAQKTLPSLDIQAQILDRGFTTGFGTDAQKAGASVLAALGVPEANKFATDAQSFLAATQQAVLQKQLEQKGPQTEADSRRVTQTGAQLGNTVDANRFIIDVAKEQLKRDIKRKEFLDSWFKDKDTLRGADDAWYAGAGGQSLFDSPGLKKYAAPAKTPSAGGFKYLGRESK